jgi:thiamine pyrophosphate-dependent acetolactate synthase large subunit-like protein
MRRLRHSARNWDTRQTIALRGDGGFAMLGLGDLSTLVERKARVVQIIFHNDSLDFVNIEQHGRPVWFPLA